MRYAGGKNNEGVYQKIINLIPPHEIYIEGFLGSGAIMRFKKLARYNLGIEINSDVAKQFTHPQIDKIDVWEMDFLAFLNQYSESLTNENVLFYLDPPYPLESRRSPRRIYEYEMTNEQHFELLNKIKHIKAMCIISTYPNELYANMLKHWNCEEFKTQIRTGAATELLYMNYEKPKLLHDFNYLGKDFIERQRIKRKIKNRIRLLQVLPELERNAIVTSILKQYPLK